jgi:hypothetical protein
LTSPTNDHLSELADSKRVAQAVCAASRLALIEGRTNEAAMHALDCIRFGSEAVRGGVIIDGLVGIAIQAMGRVRLEEAMPGLDAEASQKIVAILGEVISERELPADIFKREAQWARSGRFGGVGVVARFILPFQNRKMHARAEQKFLRNLTDLQLAQLHAAARAYELDHGRPPASARDLVPQYLKSVPLDPATGWELPLN